MNSRIGSPARWGALGWSLLACALALLSGAAPARAQEAAEASGAASPTQAEVAPEGEAEAAEEEEAPDRVLQEAMLRYDAAVEVFDRGDFGAALAEFERIYELLDGHPNQYFVLFNIGRCQEQLFRYDRAMDAYQRYLDEGGEAAEDRQEVTITIRTLENLLGGVRIAVNIPEAEVWISDRMIGTAPGVVRLPAGQHVLEVRAEGYTSVRREIVLAARQLMDQSFELSALSDFQGLDAGLFWAGLGLTAASLGVGAGFGIAALTERGRVNDLFANRIAYDPDAEGANIASLALIADIFYGIGGAFLVTTVIFAVLTDWDGGGSSAGGSGSAFMLTPIATPDSAGLSLMGAF